MKINVLLLIAGLSFSASPSFANMACVQSGLNTLGFDAGPADGLIGPSTSQAADLYLDGQQASLPELTDATSGAWCDHLQSIVRTMPRFDVTSTPAGVLSDAESASLWSAYQNARQCRRHAAYAPSAKLPVRVSSSESYRDVSWVNPFPYGSDTWRFCSQRSSFTGPEPIVSIRLNETYGESLDVVEDAITWFSDATSGIRNSRVADDMFNAGPRQAEAVRVALLQWAEADAFRRGIRVSWGNRPVDWQATILITAIVTATATIAEDLTPQERAIIGPWLASLVADIGNSTWVHRSDNKHYFQMYLAMVWGLMVGDDPLVQDAIERYKLAIHDMRPDGSNPIASQRSGFGIKYGSDSTGYLVAMAALIKSNTGQDLFGYAADGNRTVRTAVDFMVSAFESPSEVNQRYAISCPDGGDRWGGPATPKMNFAQKISYPAVFMDYFPDDENADWVERNFSGQRALTSEVFGPSLSCLLVPGSLRPPE